MAQIVKLKRTAISGKIPNISNLELGELAMNTYDGRIFFEKSSSEESIQEILTTNSHPYAVTGSIFLNGAVTASHFKGDGSQLTNLPTETSIAEATTVTASYVDSDDITVTHDFNSYNILVSVYDNNRNLLIPATTSLPTVDTARVTLSSTQSGYVVVAKGGHLISGSQIADNANKLNNQAGSYYLNWNNFNNIPSNIVSGSTQITDGSGIVSGSTQITDASDLVSGSQQVLDLVSIDEDNLVSNSASKLPTQQSVKAYVDAQILTKDNSDEIAEGSTNLFYTDARVKTKLNAETVISGSSQITDLTTHKETVSGASSYAVDHNLNEQYPIVQAWNTATSQQELPNSITTNSANRVTVAFSTTFAGIIIVKK